MDNYYKVYDFMYEDLNLSGTDLYVFAILYSFKEYKGSISYLAKAVGVKSTTTVQSSLKRLINLGLIKKEKSLNKFSTCRYVVLYDIKPNIKRRGEWTGGIDYETVIDEDFPEEEIETDIQIGWRKTV